MNLKRLMEPKMLPWLAAALLVAVLLLMAAAGIRAWPARRNSGSRRCWVRWRARAR